MLSRIQFNDGQVVNVNHQSISFKDDAVLLGLGSLGSLGSNRDQLKHVENALIDVTHKVHHKPMIAVEIACDKISLITTI